MRELCADLPEACDNTVRIAERIDIRIPEKVFHLPHYPVPQEPQSAGAQRRRILARAVRARTARALRQERVRVDAALRERLEYELGVITKMGFSSYFLIVWDFVKYARDHDIPVGPGRGSAVGSLVSYCLRITDLDPLRFNLLFERFLNPERISMPDIDTDFCVERRDEVIGYVTEKYGKDRVAQIVTFGTMAARAAVRDAGRALGRAAARRRSDREARSLRSGRVFDQTRHRADRRSSRRSTRRNPRYANCSTPRKRSKGLPAMPGTHAAGVVISAGPLIEYTPLCRFGDGGVNTQYDMDSIERIGLLKMDFLGLRNLTVMENAVA